MYILYKESGAGYPASVVPKFNVRGRIIAQVDANDPINFIKGNVKTLPDNIVETGAMFVGKWKDKYYILSDGQHSSSKETNDDEKVDVELSDEIKAASLSILKTVLISNVEDVFDFRFKGLNADVPELEYSTWSAQVKESDAYSADDSVATPVLDVLSEARGISVADLVAKISSNVASYNIEVSTLLGQQQAKVDEITSIDNVKDLLEWDEVNFGIEMPYKIAVEKGVSFEEGVLRSTPVITEVKF
mgnify:CR=1 FL=1|jgi:hypothetical protein